MPPVEGPAAADAPTLAPTLAAVERQFFTLITAPEGVAQGLATAGQQPADLERVIASDERASAVERLDVYANMYFYRIRDTLRDYFPATTAALGDDGFHNLITDYLLAHPSAHPSLRQVGRHLASFAAGHALGGERPWLGELVTLEWARLDVFDRRDEVPLDRARLQTLAPEAFAGLILRPIVAHELVPTVFAVDELWSAVAQREEEPPAPPAARAQPAALLIWRREITVFHRLADLAEAEAIGWLRGGLPFGALCERLGQDRDPEQAARQGATWLAQWLADGLLAD